MGGTWPKWFVLKGKARLNLLLFVISENLKGVDFFSVATCQVTGSGIELAVRGQSFRSIGRS